MDLFALPSKFLHPNERIRIIKQHSPFLYVIATDYMLILIDERFPGHPVRYALFRSMKFPHLLTSAFFQSDFNNQDFHKTFSI